MSSEVVWESFYVRVVLRDHTIWISKSLALFISLQWCHNEHDGVSNHHPHECLLSRLTRRTSKKASNLRVSGLCARNSPLTGEFPAQMASNAENVSVGWRHHVWQEFDKLYNGCIEVLKRISEGNFATDVWLFVFLSHWYESQKTWISIHNILSLNIWTLLCFLPQVLVDALDCFMFLKLGAAVVCALGVLLVT